MLATNIEGQRYIRGKLTDIWAFGITYKNHYLLTDHWPPPIQTSHKLAGAKRRDCQCLNRFHSDCTTTNQRVFVVNSQERS